jgi:hypothetical protein
MAKSTGKPVAVRKDKDGDITHIQFANRQKMTPLDPLLVYISIVPELGS